MRNATLDHAEKVNVLESPNEEAGSSLRQSCLDPVRAKDTLVAHSPHQGIEREVKSRVQWRLGKEALGTSREQRWRRFSTSC